MREVFVESREKQIRVAVKQNGELVQCIVEEETSKPQIGEIYKGRIKNIVPAINSIFVDIGLEKEAYMYYSDELKRMNIKKGQDILIEVVKEPLCDKGAKVTHKISIAGKNLVLIMGDEGLSLSKRIEDVIDRQRLTSIIKPIKDVGIVLRTESVKATEEELLKELAILLEKKEAMERKLRYSTNLGKLQSNTILKKFFEEIENKKTKVFFDNEEYLNNISEILKDKEHIQLSLYGEKRSLFDFYGIEKEILKLRHKKVNLPCGGYIIIDKTEAMYVIDVNSGKNIKGRDFSKTIFQTNLEAARECGRQIKLRNLSGIILIDFIDLREDYQKPKIIEELRKALKEDKGNVKVYPFTELGLIQVSRKRKGKSIYEYLEEPCKVCKSNGFLLKRSYIENLIRNEIIKCSRENSIKDFYIEIDKNYEHDITGDLFNFIKNIEGLDKEIYLNFAYDIEGYKIEPLIFSNQKDNYQHYKIKTIEKV